MSEQLDLFKSIQLRDAGMYASELKANINTPSWSEKAYSFLLKYIENNNEFMAEDVRNASEGKVPLPPSNRAWGAIFVKAAKNKMIQRCGFRKTKNPKAHRTPATLWKSITNNNTTK